MSFLDDYLPSISEVGELMAPLPSLPSLPSISEVGELMGGLPSLPSIGDSLPSISEVGELSVPLPDLDVLPDMPSISEVGEIGLPGLPPLPGMPMPISEVGELMLPDMSRPHTEEELKALREAGAVEAERGLSRRDSGDNVVGQAGDDSIIGEDGPLFPYLFGDNPEMQRFGRLHDVEAAMADADGESDFGFQVANIATAGVGGLGTLLTGDADTGAAMADSVFQTLGYETGDYANVQHDVASQHNANPHATVDHMYRPPRTDEHMYRNTNHA